MRHTESVLHGKYYGSVVSFRTRRYVNQLGRPRHESATHLYVWGGLDQRFVDISYA